MANEYKISLGAQISDAGIKRIDEQIKALSSKYKLNLEVNINNASIANLSKKIQQELSKSKTQLLIEDNTGITATEDKAAKRYSAIWSKAYKDRAAEYNKYLASMQKSIESEERLADKNIEYAQTEIVNREKIIALYKEELAIRIKNAQTSNGTANFTNDMASSVFNKADEINVNNYKDAIAATNLEFDKMSSNARAARKEATLAMKESDGFIKTLVKDFGKVIAWSVVTGALFGTIRGIQEGVVVVSQLDKAMTNVQMVTGQSRVEIVGMTKDYAALASVMHDTTLSVMQAAEEFLRAGHTQEETLDLIKSSTVMSKVAGQDQAATAEQLIAITNAYNLSAKETMNVVDKLTTVDNNSATSTAELGTALERTAASAQIAGVSFDKLVSYVGVVSSVTRKTASSIGESFNFRGIAA